MKRRQFALAFVLVLSTLLGACADLGLSWPGRGNPGNPPQENPGADNRSTTATVAITAAQARRIARELGLTGYASLPPGIARNLGRGKALPPGIAKRNPPLAMLGRLPVVDGHEWVIAGRDLVLIAIGTAIVVDILEEVFD